jgi:hypothetical protein
MDYERIEVHESNLPLSSYTYLEVEDNKWLWKGLICKNFYLIKLH